MSPSTTSFDATDPFWAKYAKLQADFKTETETLKGLLGENERMHVDAMRVYAKETVWTDPHVYKTTFPSYLSCVISADELIEKFGAAKSRIQKLVEIRTQCRIHRDLPKEVVAGLENAQRAVSAEICKLAVNRKKAEEATSEAAASSAQNTYYLHYPLPRSFGSRKSL